MKTNVDICSYGKLPSLIRRIRSYADTFVMIVCMFCPSLLMSQNKDCTIRWDNSIRISNGDCVTVRPQIEVAGKIVHLIWLGLLDLPCNGSSYGGVMYSSSTDSGKTFSTSRQLLNNDSASGSFGLLGADGKNLLVLYRSRAGPPYFYATSLIRSTDAGSNWNPIARLGYSPASNFAVRDSKIWINFQYLDSTVKGGLFISKDLGINWDTIRAGLPYVFTTDIKRVAVTSRGVHIISLYFDEQYQIEINYVRSADFGYHWSPPETLSTADHITSQLARMAATDSCIYVVWQDFKYGSVDGFHGSVLVRKSTDDGLSWEPEQVLNYTPSALGPSIAAYKNFLAVTWAEYVDNYHNRILMRVSHDYGVSWCDTVEVDSLGGDVDVALGNDFIYLTWFRDDGIFLRRGRHTPAETTPLPSEFTVGQNYPNPFNAITEIRYTLPKEDHVTIKIFDLLGREIQTLVSERKPAGIYLVQWDASNQSSGVYFCRFGTTSSSNFIKMLLLK